MIDHVCGSRLIVRCLAALAFCGLTGSTHAAVTPTQTLSIPLNDTNWSAGHMESGSNPLSFLKFDPALGTLKAVNLTLDYTFMHDISMTYDTPATIYVNVTGKTISVDGPNQTSLISANPVDANISKSLAQGQFPNVVTLPTKNQSGSTGLISLSSAADLKLFLGSSAHDAILLPVVAGAHSDNGVDSGNGIATSRVQAGATVHLSYKYDPVPEPSTLAILGLGGLAAYVVRRRSRLVAQGSTGTV